MTTPDVTFYQAAATVLAVLYLALVYQARAFESRKPQKRLKTRDVIATLAIVVILLGGEAVALRVLVTHDPSGLQKLAVVAAISLALGLLASLTVGELDDERREDLPGWATGHRRALIRATGLLVLVGTYASLVIGT